MTPKVKLVFGPRGSTKFEDRLNEQLLELHEQGFEVVSVSGISEVKQGWACTVFYREH